jgi:hypothetical protein
MDLNRPESYILIPPQNPAINCTQNSSHPEKMAIYCKNGLTGCVLSEQIHNKINYFNGFDSGTICKIGTSCGINHEIYSSQKL